MYLFVLRGAISLPRTLQLGSIEIYLYSVFILTGIGLSAFLFDKNKQGHIQLKQIDTVDALVWIIIPSMIGARMWHVMTDFYLYRDNLIEIVYLWNGGLGIFGGLIGGFSGAYFYARKQKVSLQKSLSLLAVFLPLGQIIGRFGNLTNRELYGPETSLPWGLYLHELGKSFHPAFTYEQVGNLVLFAVLYFLYKKHGLTKILIPVYLMGYGIVRFAVDFFRTEPRVLGYFTFAQLVSVLLVLLTGWYLAKLSKNSAN